MVKKRSRAVQLRLRITEEQKQILELLTQQRGRGETISDVVRYLIDHHSTTNSLPIDEATLAQLTQLAEEVNRSKSKVAEDCIFAVAELLQNDRSPLIVEEIKLRRSYTARTRGVAEPA